MWTFTCVYLLHIRHDRVHQWSDIISTRQTYQCKHTIHMAMSTCSASTQHLSQLTEHTTPWTSYIEHLEHLAIWTMRSHIMLRSLPGSWSRPYATVNITCAVFIMSTRSQCSNKLRHFTSDDYAADMHRLVFNGRDTARYTKLDIEQD